MICFVFLEVNLDNIKSNHLYLFPPTDSKPLVWLGRNNLWTFFGSLLDFFWCNTHRKSSHQNAHSGELLLFINIQDMDVNNVRADMLFIEKSAVETCLTMQVKLTLTAVEMYLCYLFCSTLQRSNNIYIYIYVCVKVWDLHTSLILFRVWVSKKKKWITLSASLHCTQLVVRRPFCAAKVRGVNHFVIAAAAPPVHCRPVRLLQQIENL